ncbi:MAG: hypothetical protein ACREOW_01460 [Thermodesulfobacteriota bacterium]
MRIKNIIAISILIICILTISIFTSGGCPIEFGGGGGDGDGGNLVSSVRGIITSQPASGITVLLVNTNNQTIFPSNPNPTETGGNFLILGDFNGCLTLRLEFHDDSQTPPNDLLAFTNVTVFPKDSVDLGNVSLENGNVILEDENAISVDFEANINFTDAPHTCSGVAHNSEGTIVVTKNNTDITVQIAPTTTDIVDTNNNDIGCDDLFGNEKVEVNGTLQVHDTVLAETIRLK